MPLFGTLVVLMFGARANFLLVSFLVKLLLSPEFWICIDLSWDGLGIDSPIFGAACRTKKSVGF